jgi:methionine-gamma-lyase
MHSLKDKSDNTKSLHGFYDSKNGYGCVKVPIYQTSTFQFSNCEQGEEFFKKASGLPNKFGDKEGYVYSRMGNPTINIYEKRISEIDGNEDGAIFGSGMGAISSTVLAFCKANDGLLTFSPLYGGTMTLFMKFIPNLSIKTKHFSAEKINYEEINKYILDEKSEVNFKNVKAIYIETPSNPLNSMTDLEKMVKIRDSINELKKKILNKKELLIEEKCIMIVDNTFLGPIFQKPSLFGCDINLYSATKFLGGHSDLVAGCVTGPKNLIQKIKNARSNLGTNTSPDIAILLLRSLETLIIRMKTQQESCIKIFNFLVEYQKIHPEVIKKILYPLSIDNNSDEWKTFKKQCTGSGSMISFVVNGGKDEAHKVIDNLHIFTSAVSLGATESLCCCPWSTTHLSVDEKVKLEYGIEPSLIRLSIGLEGTDDLINDLKKALSVLEKKN